MMSTSNEPSPFLTIVIPAYNEERRLPLTLPQVIAFAQTQPFPVEIVVVDNASTDRTAEIVRGAMAHYPQLRLLYQPVQGKCAAVRMGMLAGRGEYLFICDADLAMPIAQVTRFLPPALSGYGVAIASREVPGAARYDEPWYRHAMGRVFNLVVRLLAVPGIQDTQCGFKCFSQEAARQIFPLQRISGWGFDVELLYIALHHGIPIVEIPVNWYYGEDSRVNPIRDTIHMVSELLEIRRNGRAGLYERAPVPPVTDELPAA